MLSVGIYIYMFNSEYYQNFLILTQLNKLNITIRKTNQILKKKKKNLLNWQH